MLESFVVMGITLRASDDQINKAYEYYSSHGPHVSTISDMKEAWRSVGIVIT